MPSTNPALGLILGIFSGVLLGTFALPMKKVKIWQWENSWLMYSLWGTLILPVLLALYTIPDLMTVYSAVPLSVLGTVFFFGAMWGVANVCFGLGLKFMGLALGMAIMLGLNNALGSLLPILIYHPEDLAKPAGLAVSAGVMIMLLGIAVCSTAGGRRERVLRVKETATGVQKGSFLKGLIVCLTAGVFGAMFNFALIAGKPLEAESLANGASTLNAANATWCVSLLGGCVVTLVYILYLLRRNRSLLLFWRPTTGINWLWTFLMGVMWYGGVAVYGMAVMNLGHLGASIGWPVIQSTAVLSGNVVGLATGEWKGATGKPLQLMLAGLLLLVTGIAVIGWAGTQ